MRFRCGVAGLIVLSTAASLPAQASKYEGVVFCVARPDTTIPFSFTGFDIRVSSESRWGRVIWRSYPVIVKVHPNSPADSAGLRVDDEIRTEYGFDASTQFDSINRVRPRGPGIPIPMTVKRGDSTFSVTIVPQVSEGPKNCQMWTPRRRTGSLPDLQREMTRTDRP